VTGDHRLLIDLEVLRLALSTYLTRLHALWQDGGEAREIERLLVAAGSYGEPLARDRDTVRELLAGAAGSTGELARTSEALGLSQGEELLVAAVWWAERDPQFAAVLGVAHDDGSHRYATAALVRLLLAPFDIEVPPVLGSDALLVREGVLATVAAPFDEPLRLTGSARLVLDGTTPAAAFPELAVPARLHGLRDALTRHLESGAGGVVLLRGPEGVGRRALAAAAARDAGRVPIDGERSAAELRLLGRLGRGVPVVAAERVAALGWTDADPPLLAFGSPSESAPGAYVVELPSPDRLERTLVWHAALEDAGLDPALAPVIAARFRFTDGDVDAVMRRAALDARWDGTKPDADRVWSAARRQPEHALERLAALVVPAFTLDDLVLPERAHEQLRELIAHVALQHVVLDDWGFRRRMPRGQGVAALFAGPPGTGKTMAAEAVADALRQDLYRIDLSAVVSKYIGETEKNLASAFEEAERAGAVLFFDEADALFGRRTEVRDAHDRYANLEINYLLQRVETFTGLVVLATNRQAALDEAFLRRLRFSIRFEQPDRALRRQLWERAFPPEAEVAGLDLDALAAIELAGGNIQNAALAAAYVAAAAGRPIETADVAHALEREHEKLGRAFGGLPEPVAA
jgi:AAA+ superfamily predicted ATPase